MTARARNSILYRPLASPLGMSNARIGAFVCGLCFAVPAANATDADCSTAPPAPYTFSNSIEDVSSTGAGALASGWSATLQFYKKRSGSSSDPNVNPAEGDIWIRTYYNSVPQFDYQLGGGGVISVMRAFYNNATEARNILTPASCYEATDKVVQAVFWESGQRIRDAVKPEFAGTSYSLWNLNQAGTANSETPGTCPTSNLDIYAPTVNTTVAKLGNSVQVDVYSTPDDQWVPTVGKHLAGRVSMLTRYKVVGHGSLMVRRVMLLGDITNEGISIPTLTDYEINFGNPLLMLTDPVAYPYGFEALSLSVDSSGTPSQNALTYAAGYQMTAQQTPAGYVVAHRTGTAMATAPAVAIAFGTAGMSKWDGGTSIPYGNYYINTSAASSSKSMGISPEFRWKRIASTGADYAQPEIGAIIDAYQLITAAQGLNSAMKIAIDADTALIPAPRYYGPCSVPYLGEPGLGTIANMLKVNMKKNGMRTSHLRDTVYPYPPSDPSTSPANWPENY